MKHWIWLVLMAAWPVFGKDTTTNHFGILQRSGWFATSGGFANAVTPEGHAVAAICGQTDAVATFQRLLQEKGPAQQLYGLLGLRVLNAPEFKTALPPLLSSKSKVTVLKGCIADELEAAEVAREIQAGRWNLRAWPVVGGKNSPTPIEQ